MIFEEILTFISLWFGNRRWSRALIVACPMLIVFLLASGFVAAGWLRSDGDIVEEYLTLAEENLRNAKSGSGSFDRDLPSQSTDGGASDSGATESGATGSGEETDSDSESSRDVWESTEEIESDTGLLLRRVLQIEEFNSRATFLVALDLARSGRLSTARQMMRQIAPYETVGYGAAYAWLAAERLARGMSAKSEDFKNVMSDLEKAYDWQGVAPELISAYADFLVADQRKDEAIRRLKKRADEYPDLMSKVAEIAKSNSDDREFDAAIATAKKTLAQRIEAGSTDLMDFLNLARAYGLNGQFAESEKIARAGLMVADTNEDVAANEQTEGISKALSRALSESLRAQYHKTMQPNEDGGARVNLQLLDDAIRADPTNPHAMRDVAAVIVQGQSASEKMVDALRESLANGTATALTHLMLGNYLLQKNRTSEAVPHLEQALARSPDNQIILNNLAYALLDGDKDDLTRALSLVDKAIALSPPNPSMLDTRGEISERLGDLTNAIISYEDAIKLLPTKLNTRRKLAAAYRSAGMAEMADKQLEQIARIEKEIANKPASDPASTQQ